MDCADLNQVIVLVQQFQHISYHDTRSLNNDRVMLETGYRRTSFNCENLANCKFSRVCKLLIRKRILLIAHPYVQFAQTQLLNSQCS